MDDFEVYDYVLADTLKDGDQITVQNEEGGIDYLDSILVVKEGDTVLIRGYSEVTGDKSTYILPWDAEVGLWMV